MLIRFLLVECERRRNYGDNGENTVRLPVFPWITASAAGETRVNLRQVEQRDGSSETDANPWATLDGRCHLGQTLQSCFTSLFCEIHSTALARTVETSLVLNRTLVDVACTN